MVAPLQPSAEQGVTLEEFLTRQETRPASEYQYGRVVQKVSPRARHSRLQFMLCEAVNRQLGPALFAFPELRCTFGGRSLVPDVVILHQDRLPRSATRPGELGDDVRVAPDAVIEVVSPEQRVIYLVEKLAFCMENGVRLGWIVDPDARRVLAFRPEGYPEDLGSEGALDGGDVLPGLRLSVADVFGWLRL